MRAQLITPFFKNYTEENGLPSDWILDITEDDQGFLWVCTSQGTVKFDGAEFQLKISLPNYFQYLYEGHNGKTWLTLGNQLSSIQQGKRTLHPNHKQIMNVLQNGTIHTIHEDQSGHLWFSVSPMSIRDSLNRQSFIFEATSDSVISHDLDQDPEAHRLGNYSYWKLVEGVPIFTGRETDLLNDPALSRMSGVQDLNPEIFQSPIKRMIRLKNGSYLATASNNLLHFDQSKIRSYGEQFLPKQIIQLYEDRGGSVWISTYDGVYCVDNQQFADIHHYQPYLQGHTVTCTFQTKDGTYWFGTKEGGLYQLHSRDVSWIRWPAREKKKNHVIHMLAEENQTWFSSNDGHLYTIDSLYNIQQHPLPQSKNGFTFVKFGDQLLTSFRYLVSQDSWTRIKPLEGEPVKAKVGYYFNQIIPQNDSVFWFKSNRHGLFGVNAHQHKIFFDIRKHGFNQQIYSISRSPDHSIWLASGGDLWYVKDSIVQRPYGEYPLIEHIDSTQFIYFVQISQSGTVFLSIKDYGIVIIRDGKTQELRSGIDIAPSRLWIVSVLHDQTLWVFGQNNFQRFTFDSLQNKFVKQGTLYARTFLPKVNIQSIEHQNNRIWFATDHGMFHFHPDTLFTQARIPPRTYIESLETLDSLYEFPDQIHLSHTENNFFIKFRVVAFQNRQHLSYRYRIPGVDPTWQFGLDNNIRYTNLPPGKYVFEVESSNEDGRFMNQPTRFQFSIKPHATQTIWFYLLMTLLSLIPLGFVTIGIARFISRQNTNKRLLTELKYQALISQISPHFIFNAMNSISFLIKNQQTQLANRYLSRFGGLLRGVLEHADHTFVPLSEELQQLKSYLELEQLQMGDQLDIEFYVDPSLELAQLYVPPMLFQPAIENAIKHGISPRGKGEILVHLLEAEGRLLVAIRDDGVGRAAARHTQHSYITQKKRSIGVRNTLERIQTIKHMYGISIEMQIEDLMDNGKSVGTQVEFNFPQLTQIPKAGSPQFWNKIIPSP